MFTKTWRTRSVWVASALSALALVAASAQPALADDKSDFKAYLPGVPDTAWVVVQWQNTATGAWTTVSGWQGNVDYEMDGRPFKEWAVTSESFGDGQFRWLVYATPGGPIWGASQSFNMPDGAGQELVTTVVASAAADPSTPITAANPTGEVVAASTDTTAFACDGACQDARITVVAHGVDAATHVGVQWQDPNGNWQNVPGWQGTLDVDENGQLYKQWGLSSSNFGEGPFRWAFSTSLGAAPFAVSPAFSLPGAAGEDFRMAITIRR